MMYFAFEPRLLFALILLTLPLLLVAAVRAFGSLSAMLASWREERPPLGDVAQEMAGEVLSLGYRHRRLSMLGSGSVAGFVARYLLALLVLHSIIHEHFPSLAGALQTLAPW